MQLITSLATLAAAVSSVSALGSAIINNNCDFDVYLWPVDAQRNPGAATVISPKGSWSEVYHTPSSGGVSLKLGSSNDMTYITQFEYTVEAYLGSNFVWYDGSNVNCVGPECPFYTNGIDLKTSISSCPTRDCPINQVCSGFYTLYNDDVNSLSCDQSADTIMTLCSVVTGLNGAPAAVAPVAAAVAPPKPTTTAAPVITNEAVATTFVTAYQTVAKRAPEPVHHNHMRLHQRRDNQ